MLELLEISALMLSGVVDDEEVLLPVSPTSPFSVLSDPPFSVLSDTPFSDPTAEFDPTLPRRIYTCTNYWVQGRILYCLGYVLLINPIRQTVY